MEKEITARLMNLGGLVDYQDGSVVSRSLFNKKTGTVTLFAFDKGQSLSEHTTPFDAMVYVLDGEADVTIAGDASYLKAGDMIIMPAGAPHSLQAPKPFKMLLIMIKS